MDGTAFIGELKNMPDMGMGDNVFQNIWAEYERVILQSLVTSFGLDFLVQDPHGGDVDTIYNVRKIGEGQGKDSEMVYKNAGNAVNYENRGEYDRREYHEKNLYYHQRTTEARKRFNEKGEFTKDGYVPGNKVAYNKSLGDGQRAELDHIVAAKEIHDDPGRILSGLNGSDLANNPDNLVFTNMKLNNNMRDKTVEEYIQWCEQHPEQVNYNGKKGESLPEDVKNNLRNEYKRAKARYETKLAKNYYTSPVFLQDTASAAGKRGAEMGVRQALGFVFVEIFICAKNELKAMPARSDLADMLKTVGNGISKGLENAKNKYQEIIAKIGEGFVSGALASLTTTLCNIFFTTAKNLVKCIRQIYASVVQAGRVLLFNPENLPMGDRIKAATVILATGASVLVGTAVSELIGKTPIGAAPVIGKIVTVFCSSMVSGLLSCTLLIFLDRSKFMNKLIAQLNRIPSEVNNYKKIADAMETLAAKLADLDIDLFKKETEKYSNAVKSINECTDDEELNKLLKNIYTLLGINTPWKGDFDTFMGNRSNHLVFE